MRTVPDLAPIIGTLVVYGGACLLAGLVLGYLLGATSREQRGDDPSGPPPGRHPWPPARRREGSGHPAAGRF